MGKKRERGKGRRREGKERNATLEKDISPFTPVSPAPLGRVLIFCFYKSLAISTKLIPRYFVSLVGSTHIVFFSHYIFAMGSISI